MKSKDQALEVWGDFACFTRPEMKAERFSYPVITPSAARGIFDAIYCKPEQFRWQITKVEIISLPSYIALRRNEVKEKISTKAIQAYIKGKKDPVPIFADGDIRLTGSDVKGRTQRQTMALRDVHYHLHAEIRPWPEYEDRIQDFEAQFRRRASKGKCFQQPYFGCREFPAFFRLIELHEEQSKTIDQDLGDMGWMVYDVFDLANKGKSDSKPFISLFKPSIENGVLHIPSYDSDEVIKPNQGGYDAAST